MKLPRKLKKKILGTRRSRKRKLILFKRWSARIKRFFLKYELKAVLSKNPLLDLAQKSH